MLFNSLEFLVFYPVVFYLYYLIPHRARWPLLLASSYYFYMSWRVEYALLLGASTLVDYFVARELGRRENPKVRKLLLAISLTYNLGLLGVFKYAAFLATSANDALHLMGLDVSVAVPALLLPIAISFHTFQSLAYVIDVYRRDAAPELHLGRFAVYVAFWPQLVAGPIERARHLLPQLRQRVVFDHDRVVAGLQLVLWGFFKKVVIADRIAAYVGEVFDHPATYYGPAVILATVLFAFQIYCDFSGYSDIAIGAARTLGIDLMENFNRPYSSRSIGEFWRRWHISLSTWFRDYVYIPLGGNRASKPRWLGNLFITFLVSGIWHGASWTFVAWGALHGAYLILGILTRPLRERVSQGVGLSRAPRAHHMLDVGFNFAIVCIAWVFFRANTFHGAFILLRNALDFRTTSVLVHIPNCGKDLAIGILAIVVMEVVHTLQGKGSVEELVQRQRTPVRWLVYFSVVMTILLVGSFEGPQFIYFQF